MSVLNKRLKVSINPLVINKNESGEVKNLSRGWQNVEVTPAELARTISQGHAYCAQLKGTRSAANFLACDVLSVDFDGTRSLEEVRRDPIVEAYCTIIYTTVGHTSEKNRFRAIFVSPRTLFSAREMKAALRSLALRLNGDPSATDAARLFYGSRGSRPEIRDRALTDEFLTDLLDQSADAGVSDTIGAGKARASTISGLRLPVDALLKTATGIEKSLVDLPVRTPVHCPFHYDRNPSAFITASRSGSKGVHCLTCGQTFWPMGAHRAPFHFFGFEEAVRALPTTGKNIPKITTERFVGDDAFGTGLSFVRSPTGTGKTEALERLLARHPDKSAIVIGHRQTLIRSISTRLKLSCYLDTKGGGLSADRVGICLDSLDDIAGHKPFNIVIIDESEQVLWHFLSDTEIQKKRRDVFRLFTAVLQRAERVICLDANLGYTSFTTITDLARPTASSRPMSLVGSALEGPAEHELLRRVPCGIYLNDQKREGTIELFDSDTHLISDVMASLRAGKTIFVTSNSKRRVDRLAAAVGKSFGVGTPHIAITSSTASGDAVKAFMTDPAREARRYRCVLCSPSVSTGIDLTFPQGEQYFDVVYGFFDGPITTHFEFDQQLSRVRNPGVVKVWVTGKKFAFDTAEDVVKQDILRAGLVERVVTGIDDRFRRTFDEHDSLLDMAARIVAEQRESKNDLKRHYVDLKRWHGFTIKQVPAEAAEAAKGRATEELGRVTVLSDRVAQILDAPPLPRPKFEDLELKQKRHREISPHAHLSMERTRLERFFRRPVDRDLIELDDVGRYRDQVFMLEQVMAVLSEGSPYSCPPESRFLAGEQQRAPLIAHLLRLTPVVVGNEIDVDRVVVAADLAAFAKEILRLKPIVENVLDLHVRRDAEKRAVQQLGDLLRRIGLPYAAAPVRKKSHGGVTRAYKIDVAHFERAATIISRRREIDGWKFVNELHGFDASASAAREDDDVRSDLDRLRDGLLALPRSALRRRLTADTTDFK